MTSDQPRRAVRRPVHTGQFYEADPQILRRQIERFLHPTTDADASPPIALLAPHAGYMYSGRVAGAAYRTVGRGAFDRVLILAPSHRHYYEFEGGALPSQAAFATPLGEIDVDRLAVEALCGRPGFEMNDNAHAEEHSIEVQLPFLQVALETPFEILPVALGAPPPKGWRTLADEVFDVLDARRREGQRWLIVASSDTYHGHDAAACKENDRLLLELIETMDADGIVEGVQSRKIMACGWAPLALAILLARKAGAVRGRKLERSDSMAESGGAGGYVVGYIAAAFD